LIDILFDFDKGTIRSHSKIFAADAFHVVPVGRLSILALEHVQVIIHQIYSVCERKNPWTAKNICNFVSDAFLVEVLLNTIRHILARVPQVKLATGIPMDDKRLTVPVEEIRRHVAK
jgi:hypothetical protein